MRTILSVGAALLCAAPAFAQSIQITSSSEGHAVLQVAQAPSLQFIMEGANVSQQKLAPVSRLQVAVNEAGFSIGDAWGGALLLQSSEMGPLLPALSSVMQGGVITLRTKETTAPGQRPTPLLPANDGEGLTPSELQQLQTQLRHDADAALAKLTI